MLTYSLHHSPYWYADDPALKSYIKEKHPNAQFVTEIALKTKAGGFSENPGVVMYQATPPAPHTSKYFAYYKYLHPKIAAFAFGAKGGGEAQWAIVGLPNFDPVVEAILVGDTVTYSRYGHDYVSSPVGNAAIDGGREYTRTLGDPLPLIVKLNLLTGHFELNGESHYVKLETW